MSLVNCASFKLSWSISYLQNRGRWPWHIIWINYHTSLGFWSEKSFIIEEIFNCWNIVSYFSVCSIYFFNSIIIWQIPENIQAFLLCECFNALHKFVGLENSQFMAPTSRTFVHSVIDNILFISPSRDSSFRSFMLIFWESTIKYKFNTNNPVLGKLNFVAWILKIWH